MNIKKVDLPKEKYPIKAPYTLEPKGICIHNTYNDATAQQEVYYMQSNDSYTSFHFAVDHNEVVQGLPLNRNAWHAGDGTKLDSANRNLIAIEICFSKSGGERFDKAEKQTARLVAYLCKKYSWSIDKITKHSDYNKATACPHRTMELGWGRFIKMVQAQLDELSITTPELQQLRLENQNLRQTVADLEKRLNQIKMLAT